MRARRAALGRGSLRLRSALRVSPAVKYLNAYTGTVLLRCRKDSYRLLCSALPFVRYLESRAQRYPCFLNTLHVGGQEPPGLGGARSFNRTCHASVVLLWLRHIPRVLVTAFSRSK